MTLTQIAESPADALAARLDRARAAFAQLDQHREQWAMLNGRLYVEASDGLHCWVTDGKTCDCPDSQTGNAAKWIRGICKHIALHFLIEEQARHETLQAEAEEDGHYLMNEAVEASIIEEPPADCAWYYPTVKGLGEGHAFEYDL